MQNNEELSKPWYSISGFEDDVIISSRIRIARNLSDFVFI
jgi:protein-arginine kinase